MFTSNISLVTLVRGVGGKLSRLVYLAPRLRFGSNSVIGSFILHHNLGLFSCKRCEHYFNNWDVYAQRSVSIPLSEGEGKLSRLVYLAPRQGFGSNSVISSFLLHHNLGIFSYYQLNIISAKLRCLHPTSVWLPLSVRGGGQAVQAGLSCPPPRICVRAV